MAFATARKLLKRICCCFIRRAIRFLLLGLMLLLPSVSCGQATQTGQPTENDRPTANSQQTDSNQQTENRQAAANRDVQARLELEWELPTPFNLQQAIVVDSRNAEWMYVALKSGVGSKAALAVVDISDPRLPVVLKVAETDRVLKGSADVIVNESHAFLAAMNAGVIAFDISDPESTRIVSIYQPDVDYPVKDPNRIQHPNACGLALVGDQLFVAYDAGGLRIPDVSNPAEPKPIGRYVNPGMGDKQQAYNNIVISRNTVFAAIDYAGVEVSVTAMPPSKPRNDYTTNSCFTGNPGRAS